MVLACAAGLSLMAAAAGAQVQQDFSKVEIETNKIANNFYTLDGQGGTIGVLAGPDGVLLVDSQFAPLTDRIVAAVKQISDGRLRFLVNTHVHGDHTGGNENLGRLGVTILAREPLRARLMKPNPAANGQPAVPMAPFGRRRAVLADQARSGTSSFGVQILPRGRRPPDRRPRLRSVLRVAGR